MIRSKQQFWQKLKKNSSDGLLWFSAMYDELTLQVVEITTRCEMTLHKETLLHIDYLKTGSEIQEIIHINVQEFIPRYSRTRFYHQIHPSLLLGGDICDDKSSSTIYGDEFLGILISGDNLFISGGTRYNWRSQEKLG